MKCLIIASVLLGLCYADKCYTGYKGNTGMFADKYKLAQRTLKSYTACKQWCSQHNKCRAAVISPSGWAHRECFLVSTDKIGKRTGYGGWNTALRKHACIPKCYTGYKRNTGMFSNKNKLAQRTLKSYDACKKWCSEHSKCKAAVVSPSGWAHRECFLVSTDKIGKRTGYGGWNTAFQKSC